MKFWERKIILPWHAKSKRETLVILSSSVHGLSDEEAAQRLKTCGYNELRAKKVKNLWNMAAAQFLDPMVLILIAASVTAYLLHEFTEAAVIFIIVITNAIIGVVQEYKAQAALEALKSMSPLSARVLRQGEESVIPSREVVPGDIVILRDGDMVPADIRLLDDANLKVQEASLTGESVPCEKEADVVLPEDSHLNDRINMVYTSSIVTYGRATGVVTETGMNTEIGSVAALIENHEEIDTPLKRKLAAAGKSLTVIGIIVCIAIFITGALYGRPLVPLFLTGVALAISIIPEGLPATATVVMALGVQRMAKRNALIRKLAAVETLGNASVICSDKTGTLTLNKMQVAFLAQEEDLASGKAVALETALKRPGNYSQLINAACLCNDASFDPDKPDEVIGDPTEGALIMMGAKFGINQEEYEKEYPRLFEQPFDSNRKRMTTVHKVDGYIHAYTKGAVESLLPECSYILTAKGIRDITDEDKERISEICTDLSAQAMRTLGFAMKLLSTVPQEESDNVEYKMVFIGLVGMIDPPRREVAAAIRTCREAGIKTVMITGDHRLTALAIAKELGIYRQGDSIIGGEELCIMTDKDLDAAVKNTTVFSRVSPADKLRIINALKRSSEVVAMTGDGVNDSPALKAADIGVAMGITGTDIAKDAADIVLLDDSFNTIAYAIKEGRRIYNNLQMVIKFLLVGNIAEITTLFIATLLNWDAPLSASHILWVNLATATLPAIALGVAPASRDVMSRQPVKSGTLFEKELVKYVVIQGVFTAGLTIAAYWYGMRSGSYAAAQTMAFCVLAFSQMLRAFTVQNSGSTNSRPEMPNHWLKTAVAASAVLMAGILLLPEASAAFKLTWLASEQWAVVFVLALFSSFPLKSVLQDIGIAVLCGCAILCLPEQTRITGIYAAVLVIAIAMIGSIDFTKKDN